MKNFLWKSLLIIGFLLFLLNNFLSFSFFNLARESGASLSIYFTIQNVLTWISVIMIFSGLIGAGVALANRSKPADVENTAPAQQDKQNYFYFKTPLLYLFLFIFFIFNFVVMLLGAGTLLSLVAVIIIPPIFLIIGFMILKDFIVGMTKHKQEIILDKKKFSKFLAMILIFLILVVVLNSVIYFGKTSIFQSNVPLAVIGGAILLASVGCFFYYLVLVFSFLSFIKKSN